MSKPITSGYGSLITGVTAAVTSAHPDNDGSLLIQVEDRNLSCSSDGKLSLNQNTGPDEKWWKSAKCMVNINTFSGMQTFFLEWFE